MTKDRNREETALAPSAGGALALPQALVDDVQRAARAARAPETWRVYQGLWRHFERWCARHQLVAIEASPGHVAGYLVDCAKTLGVSSLDSRRAALSAAFTAAGKEPPTWHPQVRLVLQGLRRTRGAPAVRKSAATGDVLAQLIATIDQKTLRGKRDAALLLVGHAGAFRRAALCAVQLEHVAWEKAGARILVPFDKTDQLGEGLTKAIPFSGGPLCAAAALKRWISAAALKEGALFRRLSRHGGVTNARLGGAAVALIVKRACSHAGLDPTLYAGHSLRAGFVTDAARANAPLHQIMHQTGHKDPKTLMKYIREVNPFFENAVNLVKPIEEEQHHDGEDETT